MTTQALKEKIIHLPKEAGCYLMKDSMGRIIYVGKAKNLRARIGQYFGNDIGSYKTKALVEAIRDFEIIITKTEVEALLLERTLIKHHKPRFNVLLRDDKEYPFIRVNYNEDWPRIEKVRRRKDDGGTYIGPFSSSGNLKVLLDATLRIFPVIRCSRHEFANTKRPCNYYHMKMCLAPCSLDVKKDQYKATLKDAMDFLAGKGREVIKTIEKKMEQAAEDEQYELAALYRDQLKAFALVTERQSVVMHDLEDADIFGIEQGDGKTSFHILSVRGFYLVSQDNFVLKSEIATREEALGQFLLQYYDSRSIPREVILPINSKEIIDLGDLRLALMAGHPEARSFEFVGQEASPNAAKKGSTNSDLLDMAARNAQYRLNEVFDEIRLGSEKTHAELVILQEKLQLSRLPRRMECIDISNIQGTAIVASNVCFVNGKPAKEFYRHYNIRSVADTPNDFASITEVVSRRIKRGIEDGDMPDLLIIDGGKGQLSAAFSAAKHLNPLPFDLISLAKSRSRGTSSKSTTKEQLGERTFERVFFLDQDLPLALNVGTPEYRLLTQIRDEAHRFAITHHRKVRAKLAQSSTLTDIPGIGPMMHKNLLMKFGDFEGLKKASLSEILAIRGLRDSAAVALFSFLQSNLDGSSTPTEPDIEQTTDQLNDKKP